MRRIKKVAILGSGIMGSRIACHFANIGVQVLLLDIVPRELSDVESKKGLTLDDKVVRNRIVNDALKIALKTNPSPVYHKSVANKIETGNLTDDLSKISDCDWVLEAVIENLKIKNQVFEEVEKNRKQGTIVSTNTSGIPINHIAAERSDDFKKNFIGTHFFNPPRYLRLLEIIPTPDTDADLVDFLMEYGDLYLGKSTVLCKDTPAFIANRIGVFSIMSLFHTVAEMGLTVEEVDKLTGPVLGRPKSATFRTCDVVGLDTLVKVANGVYENCQNDEQRDLFKLPDYINQMVEKNMLGAKTKKGFYQKVKDEKGKSIIQALNLKTLEYAPSQKAKFATLEATKSIDGLKERMPVLLGGKDKAGEFYRKSFYQLFSYVSHRLPEIADDLYNVDAAMEAGFGWELPVFEAWDALGVKETVDAMKEHGFEAAPWVNDMLSNNCDSFYSVENGIKNYYDINAKKYKNIPGADKYIALDNLRNNKTVWTNGGCNVIDLGDGILNVEFNTKMNSIGSEIIQGVHKAIDLAEKDYRGVVIANNASNFSVGANLGMIFMLAIEQEYDEIDMAVRMFQNVNMRIRYSSVAVVVAPHNMALGGGCEMAMHADKIKASAETYMGLVEFGVGLI
ncbi:MAG: 3-hydroxyacyl-CoA dehydrogenase/enoyl-CoA hydratase family protein, partial [Bacteroidia bacterium]|nr:3-hydroxyacyl-CoA dehydrogenase/enoyl-CoA hydratase family protein [Bacteroidia bacterium]